MGDRNISLLAQQHAGQMGGRASPCGAVIDLAGIGFREGQKLLQILGRKVLAQDDVMGGEGERADGLEALDRIIGGAGVERGARDMRRDVMHEHGVTVGRGARGAKRARRAAGAGGVFNDELLTKRARKILAIDARGNVRRAARCKRHDDGDGLCRVILRERGAH